MKQSMTTADEADVKKTVVACGVASLVMCSVGVATMAANLYGMAGSFFAGGVILSLFGLGACVQFLRDNKQQEK